VGEGRPNPLQGKRIVITRAADQRESLVAGLRASGAIVVLMPLVAFAAPDDVQRLDDTVANLGGFDWIFLTSQNALRALQDSSARLLVPLGDAIKHSAIAAVGPATAEAARQAGLSVTYVAGQHDGVSLARELAAEVKGKKVLLPRSDRANPDLVMVLGELGAVVTEVVAYKTLRTDGVMDRWQEVVTRTPPDAVLFFSPSAVHHLKELLGGQHFAELSTKVVYAAIGTVTERAIRAAGVERILKAADTTVSSIVEALTEHFASAGSVLPAGVKRG
jgi:uroporphyrinogen III methyltransferase / synthase